MHYVRRRKRYRIEGYRAGGRFIDVLRWQFTTLKRRWPVRVENAAYGGPPPAVYRDQIKVTWLGHATLLIQVEGANILTDPFFSVRASPSQLIGPRRVRAAPFRPDELPHIDVVLLSHNHYDHLDVPGLRRLLKHHTPTFVTPLGNKRYLQRARRSINCIELDWRQQAELENLRITCMPALHWSKRSVEDANKALWGAFVIETPGGVIYFAGDTGYGDGGTFREVCERFGSPRVSLLPIGAYEPYWFMKPMHMNPDDAVKAHLDLGSQTSIAMHHGTIQLTNEKIDQPLIDLATALDAHGVTDDQFMAPDVGETVDIP